MAGPSSLSSSPGDDRIAAGEVFVAPAPGTGPESWDQPVRACPMWPPELALPPGDSRLRDDAAADAAS